MRRAGPRTWHAGSQHCFPSINDQSPYCRILDRRELASGKTAGHPTDPYMDLTRLRDETGFEPRYSLETGIPEYVAWLRKGNPR
jgi:nucleoside-diphosphate-sugar epimerase